MEIELVEIKNHLKRFSPFKALPETVLNDLVSHIEVSYYQNGTKILGHRQENHYLYYIRSGAVEIKRSNGQLYSRCGEGETFGQFSLLRGYKVRYPAWAIEDALIYLIPDEQFQHLCDTFDDFADFMEEDHGSRLLSATTKNRHSSASPLLMTPVRKLIRREVVTASESVSIKEAAKIMSNARVSSLVLLNNDHAKSAADLEVKGLITDRDFRERAIIPGLSFSSPVKTIMSTNVITCQAEDHAFEAMLTMMRHDLHHLPVLSHKQVVGVINIGDIVQFESHGTVFLAREIFKQPDVTGLKRIAREMRLSFVQLVNEGANSHMIGSAMSGLGRNICQRLLQLGESEFGPPPVPYCFLVFGSMAREEQLIVADQDHAFVLHDDFIEAEHDAYFKSLAQFVSDGLSTCGYPYCSGDIMATNPRWRQPLSVWQTYFENWIERPNPEALLHCSIFFDLAGIHGEGAYADQLTSLIRGKVKSSQRFLNCLAHNALLRTPPLGFFKTFVLEPDGEHKHTFNLKRRGTAPISDLVRVHALACGSDALNTLERIDDIHAADLLPEGTSDDLKEAMEFISMVRIRHQALQLEKELSPDNNIEPESLSRFERRHLKDAFQVLRNQQSFLRYLTKGSGWRID